MTELPIRIRQSQQRPVPPPRIRGAETSSFTACSPLSGVSTNPAVLSSINKTGNRDEAAGGGGNGSDRKVKKSGRRNVENTKEKRRMRKLKQRETKKLSKQGIGKQF